MAELIGTYVFNSAGYDTAVAYGSQGHTIAPGEILHFAEHELERVAVFDPGPLPPPIKVLAHSPTASEVGDLFAHLEGQDPILVIDLARDHELNVEGFKGLVTGVREHRKLLVLRIVDNLGR